VCGIQGETGLREHLGDRLGDHGVYWAEVAAGQAEDDAGVAVLAVFAGRSWRVEHVDCEPVDDHGEVVVGADRILDQRGELGDDGLPHLGRDVSYLAEVGQGGVQLFGWLAAFDREPLGVSNRGAEGDHGAGVALGGGRNRDLRIVLLHDIPDSASAVDHFIGWPYWLAWIHQPRFADRKRFTERLHLFVCGTVGGASPFITLGPRVFHGRQPLLLNCVIPHSYCLRK
jgi:hypothetical protein